MPASEALHAAAYRLLDPPAPMASTPPNAGEYSEPLARVLGASDGAPPPLADLGVFCEAALDLGEKLDGGALRRGLFQCARGWASCFQVDSWTAGHTFFVHALLSMTIDGAQANPTILSFGALLASHPAILTESTSSGCAANTVPAYFALGCVHEVARGLLKSFASAAARGLPMPAVVLSSLVWADSENPLACSIVMPRPWLFPVHTPGLRWTDDNISHLKSTLRPRLVSRSMTCAARELDGPLGENARLAVTVLGVDGAFTKRRIDNLVRHLSSPWREPRVQFWDDEFGGLTD